MEQELILLREPALRKKEGDPRSGPCGHVLLGAVRRHEYNTAPVFTEPQIWAFIVGVIVRVVFFIAVRTLPMDMNAKQYLAAVQSGIYFPEGALDYSGLGLTSPGHQADMWLRLDPGNYLLFCWYKGHSSGLPAHELKVVDDGSADIALPDVHIVVRLVDFRFEVAGDFRSGPQVIRVETPGPSMHEVDIFRLNDGMEIDDLRRWYKSGRDGPAPVTAFSGVLDNHDIRREVWVKTNLVSGRYVLWCNMPMSTDPAAAATGRP